MSTTSTTRPQLVSGGTLGTLGVAGSVYFFISVVAMHVIEPNLSPIERFVSDYANGRAGWLQGLAFIVFGIGILSIAVGLYRALNPQKRATAAAVLYGIFGVGIIAAGIFPTDVPLEDGTTGYTFAGQMHDVTGIFGFLSLIAGTFLLRGIFARHQQWQALARPARWFSWAILVGLLVFVIVGEITNLVGILQRIWLVIVVTWLILLAVHLRQIGSARRIPEHL